MGRKKGNSETTEEGIQPSTIINVLTIELRCVRLFWTFNLLICEINWIIFRLLAHDKETILIHESQHGERLLAMYTTVTQSSALFVSHLSQESIYYWKRKRE